jgi:hypothetical protein
MPRQLSTSVGAEIDQSPVPFAKRLACEKHRGLHPQNCNDINNIKVDGEIAVPPSPGDIRAFGERFPGSLRSPTLKPQRQNPRKPAVLGAIDAWKM